MRIGMGIGISMLPRNAAFSLPTAILGFAQGMRAVPQGKSGGANINSTSRTPHKCPVDIKRSKLILPVFESALLSSPTRITDQLHSGSTSILNFQAGLEHNYNFAASTGIAPRIPWMKDGNNYLTYNEATHDANFGYLETDWLDEEIPADEDFGIWLTVELPAGVYSNAIPFMFNATNFIDRNIGQSFSGSSRISALGGSSDFALNSTSINKIGTTQAGVTGIFTPAMMLIECAEGTLCIVPCGDSLGYGNNEGQAGSSTAGDSMGDIDSCVGMLDRGIKEAGHLIGVNISRGSDGYKYLKTPDNWKYRRQLMVKANPSHVLMQQGVNDVSASITISGWAQSTALEKQVVRSANGAGWMTLNAGTTLGSGTGPSGAGPTFQDNDILWYRLGNLPASANPRGWMQIFADMCIVDDQIKEVLPDVKIVKTKVTPGTSSNNSFLDSSGQTAQTGWGDATSRWALLNVSIAGMDSNLRIDGVIDPLPLIGDATEPFKWKTDGININLMTQDGTHHNSFGAFSAMPAIRDYDWNA